MAVPRIALIVPLLLGGFLLPAANAEPQAPLAGTLGMEHEKFSQNQVTVDCGQTLTLRNNSRFLHIIGPGRDGVLSRDAAVPVARRELLETDHAFTTGTWNTPGVHYLTCSVHPEMTVAVTVRSCSGTASR